jgi:hypothetical protein
MAYGTYIVPSRETPSRRWIGNTARLAPRDRHRAVCPCLSSGDDRPPRAKHFAALSHAARLRPVLSNAGMMDPLLEACCSSMGDGSQRAIRRSPNWARRTGSAYRRGMMWRRPNAERRRFSIARSRGTSRATAIPLIIHLPEWFLLGPHTPGGRRPSPVRIGTNRTTT